MIINVGQDVGEGEESLFTVVGTTVATIKINGRSFKKLEVKLPYDLAITTLGIYPNTSLIHLVDHVHCCPLHNSYEIEPA